MFGSLNRWPRAILHLDGDAFFASCEQAVHPEYRGKPVVTGKERGIVSAASYEAKACGISRGVPLHEVRKLCPEAIIVPSDYETYSLFSKRMFAIMRRFSPQVEEYSIDEAFADITGLRRPLRASYESIARSIKRAVEQELGITVSVGLSLSKGLAKLASKSQKPNGCVVVPEGRVESLLSATPVAHVWGIGPQTSAYCAKLGIRTALDFVQKPQGFMEQYFTKPHIDIWRELRGESVYAVNPEEKTSYDSISKFKTFTPSSGSSEFVLAHLFKNLENACIKARRHRLLGNSITVYLRTQDFRTIGAEAVFSRASAYPHEIAHVAKTLFSTLFDAGAQYRATGIVLAGLIPDQGLQPSLFESPAVVEKTVRLYKAVDELAEKMGKHSLHLGASMSAHTIPTHATDRGEIPMRKLSRMRGETVRKHLAIPMLAGRGLAHHSA